MEEERTVKVADSLSTLEVRRLDSFIEPIASSLPCPLMATIPL